MKQRGGGKELKTVCNGEEKEDDERGRIEKIHGEETEEKIESRKDGNNMGTWGGSRGGNERGNGGRKC